MRRKRDEEAATIRPVRDKAFARRLNEACDQYRQVPPYNFGRLTWIKDHLLSDFKISVSMETVRKWFAGEARPRPDKMKILAALLYVDEAWLSLGITPEMEPTAKQAFNAMAPGAANLVAGMIQLQGGHPTFPEAGNPRTKNTNLCAIIKGKGLAFYVSLGNPTGKGESKFTFPAEYEHTEILGVIDTGDLTFDILRFPADLLEEHADKKGGFAEITVHSNRAVYSVGKDKVPKIKSFLEFA